jgi:hypothetical protein
LGAASPIFACGGKQSGRFVIVKKVLAVGNLGGVDFAPDYASV